MTQSMSLKLICSCIVAAVFVIGAASCATSKYQQRVLSTHGACQRHMGYSRLNVLLNRNHHLFTNKKTIISVY